MSADEKSAFSNWIKINKHGAKSSYFGLYKNYNLIVVQVESMEKFVLGRTVGGVEITPTFNKMISSNGIYFENFFEQVGSGMTSDAEHACVNSVYAPSLGSAFLYFPHNRYASLGYILKRNGYYTANIHPDSSSTWNWREAQKHNGFDYCLSSEDMDRTDSFGPGISDESFFAQLEDKIAGMKKPFFVFCITLSSHVPYDIAKEKQVLSLGPTNETGLGRYLQAIAYTDWAIGKFLSGLDKMGLLEDTVLVFYGDHEGVHCYYRDQLNSIEFPGDWWKENNHHVPLLIYQKKQPPVKIEIAGGQIDILPTVCNLLGIPSSEWEKTAFGRDLLNTDFDFALLRDGRIVRGGNIDNPDIDETWITDGRKWADKVVESDYYSGLL